MKKVTLQCSSVTISITFIAMKLFKLLYCNCFQMFGLKRRERVPSFRPSSLQVQCHSQGGQHQRCPHGGETPQQQENATHGKDGALHITSASSRTQELKSLHIRAQVKRGLRICQFYTPFNKTFLFHSGFLPQLMTSMWLPWGSGRLGDPAECSAKLSPSHKEPFSKCSSPPTSSP